jgi:hypothetical protein
MDKDYLVLKRASASRLSIEWSDDDFDVLAEGIVVGRIMKAAAAPAMDAGLWPARRSLADLRLRGDARGRHGSLRQELAAGVVQFKLTTEVEATSILLP